MYSPKEFEDSVALVLEKFLKDRFKDGVAITVLMASIDRTRIFRGSQFDLESFTNRGREIFSDLGCEFYYFGDDRFFVLMDDSSLVNPVLSTLHKMADKPRIKLFVGIGDPHSEPHIAFKTAEQAWLASVRLQNHSVVDFKDYYSKASLSAYLIEGHESGALLLHFQPKRSAKKSGEEWPIVGYEALARLWLKGMNHGEEIGPGPQTSPDHGKECCFLAAIKAHGMQSDFDYWVLKTIRPKLRREISVSVNMYASMIDRELAEFLANEFEESELGYLEIEVLEHEHLSDEALEVLQLLATKHKISIALDDFGKGASNIGVLAKLPPGSILKVDQSFVRAAKSHPAEHIRLEIQRAAIGFAKVHGLNITFEGVETEDHAKSITDLLCNAEFPLENAVFQGWFCNGKARHLP